MTGGVNDITIHSANAKLFFFCFVKLSVRASFSFICPCYTVINASKYEERKKLRRSIVNFR